MAACYIYIEEESFVMHRSYDTIDINHLPWHNLLPCTSISYIQRLKEPKSSTMLAFAYIFWAPVCLYWHVDSLAPGKFERNFRHVIFKQILVIDGWGISCEIALNVTGLHWWSVNIGSGNGLVPSGNKPLPEPMLIKISNAIWRH